MQKFESESESPFSSNQQSPRYQRNSQNGDSGDKTADTDEERQKLKVVTPINDPSADPSKTSKKKETSQEKEEPGDDKTDRKFEEEITEKRAAKEKELPLEAELMIKEEGREDLNEERTEKDGVKKSARVVEKEEGKENEPAFVTPMGAAIGRHQGELNYQRTQSHDRREEKHGIVLPQPRTRYEEREEQRLGNVWNQPSPRSERPQTHELQQPANSWSDFGLRRQEEGNAMATFTTEDRGRVHQQGEAIHPNNENRGLWDKEQHQGHSLHQHLLQNEQQATITFAGVAVVTIPVEEDNNQEPTKPMDINLERERIERLHFENARMHGGVAQNDSEISALQNEVDTHERERVQARQLRVERVPQQMMIPMVVEATTNLTLDGDSQTTRKEVERLHHVHDDIMQEIKSGPHLDSFDK